MFETFLSDRFSASEWIEDSSSLYFMSSGSRGDRLDFPPFQFDICRLSDFRFYISFPHFWIWPTKIHTNLRESELYNSRNLQSRTKMLKRQTSSSLSPTYNVENPLFFPLFCSKKRGDIFQHWLGDRGYDPGQVFQILLSGIVVVTQQGKNTKED